LSLSFLALSYFIHLLATVIWIGGLMVLATLVVPEVRRVLAGSAAQTQMLSRLRQRFNPVSNLCLVILFVTGMFQTVEDPNYTDLLVIDTPWSIAIFIKHIAALGMIIIGGVLQYGVIPALERASLLTERGKGDAALDERLRRRETRLTWVNIVLAVIVLACTAAATAI
jgi:uncharacterized membrane protein